MFRRLLITALALVLALAAPATAQFSFLGLKNSLVQFALEQISVPGELEITAEGVEEDEDGATDIVGLAVADGDGVWLRAERLSLRWNAARILRGELEITRIALDRLEVLRAPNPGAAAVEVKEGSALAGDGAGSLFDWPRSPITVRIDEMALTNAAVAPGVIAGQGLGFDATGALRDEGDEQALRLLVDRTDGRAGRIALDFLRNFATNRLDLTLVADEAPGGLVAELAGFPEDSASRVALTGQGPLTDWALTLDAAADRVFAAAGDARLVVGDRLSARAAFEVTPGPALDPALQAALSPSARLDVDIAEDEAGVVRVNAGELRAADLSLTGAGVFDRAAGVADLTVVFEARAGLSALVEGLDFERVGFDGAVSGPVDDLAAEGAFSLAGLRTAPADVGAAELTGAVRIRPEAISLNLSGGASGLRLDRLGPEELGEAALTVEGVYAGDVARLARLGFSAAPLTLEASGAADLGAGSAELTYRLDAPALAPLARAYDLEAGGAFSAEGALTGPLDGPRLVGALTLAEATIAGQRISAARLDHDAVLSATPEGRVTLTADAEAVGPARFDGGFRLDGDRLALNELALTALGAEVAGEATVDLASTLVEGQVTVAAPDIAPIASLGGVEAAGAIEGALTLRPEEGVQIAAFDIAASGLAAAEVSAARADLDGVARLGPEGPTVDARIAFADLAAPGARIASGEATAAGGLPDLTVAARLGRIDAGDVSVAGARLDAKASGLDEEDPRIDARATAGAVDFGGGRLDSAALSARGRLSALDLGFETAGRLGDEATGRPLAARLAARADLSGPPRATVSTLSAALDDFEIAARRPFEAAVGDDGAARLSGLDLGFPGGGLTGEATVGGAGLAGDLDLSIADPAPLAKLADLPVGAGRTDVAMRFDTRAASAGAAITLTARDVTFEEATEVGALNLDAALDWNGAQADARATLSGPFGAPAQATFSLPLRPTGGALPAVPPRAPISGGIDWAGEIGELWALVPAPGHILAGATVVAVRLGGTLDAPELSGDVRLTDGRYENLDAGTILLDLDASTRVGADRSFILDLSAHDGANRPVTATVALADGVLDAQVTAEEATLVRRDDAVAVLTLDVRAAGPVAAPAIRGDIVIDRAEIRLIAGTPDVPDLGEVRVKGAPPPEREEAADSPITLDLTVKGPRDIFVRGRGLDSEWAVDLTITGTTADPRITGAVDKRRGVLSFLGRLFDLEQGAVRFTGAPGVDPTLNIQLLRENDGVTGGIAVSGTAKAPQVSFTSRPALPEEEVLPRVLFGRSKQSLSPAEALTLAGGLVTLMDGSGGAMDDVRGSVGLDVLRVDQTEEGDATVAVGSNITENVYVGVKQPINNSGSATFEVEVEVFDNVTVDSEFGDDSSTSIGLNWKRDY